VVSVISFNSFQLDLVNAQLRQGAQPIPITPKSFAVLHYLLQHPGRLVTKEDLLAAVWPKSYVGDAVLKVCIREIRKALGDDIRTPRFIETAHRRGYRFIGQITYEEPAFGDSQSAPGAAEQALNRLLAGADLSWFCDTCLTASQPPTLVGRDEELEQLQDWLGRALKGDHQWVFVSGELGIGKTSLVAAFVKRILVPDDLWIARGQCFERYGNLEPYLPVVEALYRLCREPGKERLLALLDRHAPSWLRQMPELVISERFTSDSKRRLQESDGTPKERMIREIALLIEVLTAEIPLVLILEDLQWSDHTISDLISYLAGRLTPARLMIIATYRPQEVALLNHPLKAIKQELQIRRQCRELSLGFLGPEAVGKYIAIRFPESRFTSEVSQLLHQYTEGNPLFMVNTVDYWLAKGVLTSAGGALELKMEEREVGTVLPPTIRQIIEQQLEQLTEEEQRVLEAASVVGVGFSAAALAALLERDVVRVEECCERLVRRHQFLKSLGSGRWPERRTASRYAFIHVLYQSILYRHMPAARRVQLQRQIEQPVCVRLKNGP
jgi:predicted ATPase/DNA-binding winged helix-turn-helix (wHTH) protein